MTRTTSPIDPIGDPPVPQAVVRPRRPIVTVVTAAMTIAIGVSAVLPGVSYGSEPFTGTAGTVSTAAVPTVSVSTVPISGISFSTASGTGTAGPGEPAQLLAGGLGALVSGLVEDPAPRVERPVRIPFRKLLRLQWQCGIGAAIGIVTYYWSTDRHRLADYLSSGALGCVERVLGP